MNTTDIRETLAKEDVSESRLLSPLESDYWLTNPPYGYLAVGVLWLAYATLFSVTSIGIGFGALPIGHQAGLLIVGVSIGVLAVNLTTLTAVNQSFERLGVLLKGSSIGLIAYNLAVNEGNALTVVEAIMSIGPVASVLDPQAFLIGIAIVNYTVGLCLVTMYSTLFVFFVRAAHLLKRVDNGDSGDEGL